MLRFRTFGTIDLRREDGERLEDLLGQPKRLALLAYLADRQPSGPVRREQILSLLWPDSAPSSARHALSSTLSRLRQTLGKEVIRGTGKETLWLSREYFRSDAAAFQEALEAGPPREALDLYRGPFLEGFRPPDSRPYEDWMEQRRGTYRRRAYEAGLEAGVEARNGGNPEAAEDCLRRAHELEPLREEAAEELVQGLVEQGRRGDGRRVYEEYRKRLRDELDRAPSTSFEELVAGLPSDRSASDNRAATADADSRPSQEAAVSAGEGGGHLFRGTIPPGSRSLAAGLLVVFALVAGGLWVWYALSPGGTGGDTTATADPADASPTVAVLPFQDLGGDQEISPFLRGFRTMLLTELSQVPEVRVVSETSADRFYDTDLALPSIADSLQARWVLEGAVQQVGDTVQVHTQLIDSETDTHVWAQTLRRDRPSQHLFDLQRELAQRIIETVALELGTETRRDVTAPPTERPGAYDLYLEARGLSYTEGAPEAKVNRSIRLYRRALRLDSAFAQAWAGLADAYADRIWAYDYPRSWADSGISAAREAIRHAPDLPDGYSQLGDNLGVLGRTEAQIDAYREALRLRPAHVPTVNNLAYLLTRTGRLADAMKWVDRAYRASPGSVDLLPLLVFRNVRIGRENAAEAWLRYARREGLELLEARFGLELFVRNDLRGARSTLQRLREGSDEPYYQRRAALAVYEEDWEQALRLYRTFAQDHHLALGREGTLSAGPGWAVALDRLGRDDEARSVARKTLQAVSRAPEGFGQAPKRRVQTAVASLVLGDTARALTKLSEAVDLGYRNVPVMRNVPVLDSIRNRPEFRSLLGRVDSLIAEERRRVEEAGWGMPPERFLTRG